MELGPQNHNGDGLLGPNSIIVVYMDPLGMFRSSPYDSLELRPLYAKERLRGFHESRCQFGCWDIIEEGMYCPRVLAEIKPSTQLRKSLGATIPAEGPAEKIPQ